MAALRRCNALPIVGNPSKVGTTERNVKMTNHIRVTYWRGTTQCEGKATTYRGAMRIASRNRNAYGPCFYAADGEKLLDDGNGLMRESVAAQSTNLVYEV